jgi:hypothetical protein
MNRCSEAYILNLATKAAENEDIEMRVTGLERAAELTTYS